MTTIRKIVSHNLRILRGVRGMSQEDLSAIAGIDRTFISDIENAKYGTSIDRLESLAGALGVATWEMCHPQTADRIRKQADADASAATSGKPAPPH
ncbi:XRE family transcriptional regulator [Sphingomonas gilva]|uniref:XRE family transcriptional regulator n=1 Tax=Sphingomonas gilva TaxID=2305907 RepID=A0A396RPU6_9SPHN|nr:helix-turn-helix transcriptional regulator [Sphingomonas gilva]RHW18550.1 XRE family transcriptional regulator [Sphingomonas gilva]